MKISRYAIIVLTIAVALFIVPFFWVESGGMDLGGDSSRLYFYDPVSYIHAHVLYNIVSSGIGGNAISYYSLPFMLVLVGIKQFFSTTNLISIINGVKISLGFVFCYLIVKELLYSKTLRYKDFVTECSAIVAGLLYSLSPILINSGWERSILSHMQVFFNPLFFYLTLKFFVADSKKYLIGLLVLTFIFSIGFSYAAAPPFFAFYPVSLVFIVLYTKYIREQKIPLIKIAWGVVLFILLQAFHIVPHLIGILSFGSDVSASVFSDQTKFSRGLDYFTAIAPSVKVSTGFMGLPQLQKINILFFMHLLFPFIILLGLFYNKSKTILITAFVFLIVLFFATANITDTGFFFYKSLFYIPGFKMFRNFYGQWAFAFAFFYTILFGQCLAIVLNRIKLKYKFALCLIIATIIFLNSFSFLIGEKFNTIHHQSKISAVFKMDPLFEQTLDFIAKSPIDAKTLTLPLTGPGYQVVSGKDEKGAYVGPSLFSYLVGKNDYTGYEGFAPFGDFFVNAIKEKDYHSIRKLFSYTNIKYVVYNSDKRIYDNYFPDYPYDYVKQYLPDTQEEYKKIINSLPLDFSNKIGFGNNFHIYPVQKDVFLPHIYLTSNVVYTREPLYTPLWPAINDFPLRTAFLDVINSRSDSENIILEAENDNPFLVIFNNFHLHKHNPFISVSFDNFIYPFVYLR